MKRILSVLVFCMTMVASAEAMSYDQAREEALFLTDKMAYELDLSEEQYEAVYEVNFDYLLNIQTADDCFGEYWKQRDLDMSYILFDWQYSIYCTVEYFYRPIYWEDNAWHFGVYVHYTNRDRLYFGTPIVYVSYKGEHCWKKNGGHSWYHGRSFGSNVKGRGMRSSWNKKVRSKTNQSSGSKGSASAKKTSGSSQRSGTGGTRGSTRAKISNTSKSSSTAKSSSAARSSSSGSRSSSYSGSRTTRSYSGGSRSNGGMSRSGGGFSGGGNMSRGGGFSGGGGGGRGGGHR